MQTELLENPLEVITGENDIPDMVNNLVALCYSLSYKSGWHHNKAGELIDINAEGQTPTKLCLIHSEVSEAMEGYRKGLNDDHLSERKMFEVELADAVIRIFDLAGAHNLDLGGALLEKLVYNQQRPDHSLAARAEANGKSF